MKARIVWLILFCVACGGNNKVTEVGNPTRGATAGSTTQAVSSAVNGLVTTVSESALVKKEVPTGLFDCLYNEAARRETCNCPKGGTVTFQFETPFEVSDSLIVFDHPFTGTFDHCQVSACDESVTMSGGMLGRIVGSFAVSGEEGELLVDVATEDPCSGLSDGDDFGFDLTMTFNGTTHEFSGEFCIDGVSISFDNLDELDSIVDPEGVCETS